MSNTIPVEFAYQDKGLDSVGARMTRFFHNASHGAHVAGEGFKSGFEGIEKWLGPIVALGGGALGAAEAMHLFREALHFGGEMQELGERIGTTAGQAAILTRALKNAGVPGEELGPIFNKMQKALTGVTDSGEPANHVFDELGLNIKDLQSLAPEEQFAKIGEAINGLKTPAERATASMELFGKSGGKMLALFGDSGGLKLAAAEVGGAAGILDRDAAMFDEISDKMSAIGEKVQGFMLGVADQVVPAIQPIVDFFATADFAGAGQAFGNIVATAIEAMTDGSIWQILENSAMVTIGTAVNELWAGIQAVGAAFGQSLVEDIKTALTLFSIVTTGDFWKGMGDALMGIGRAFDAFMLDAIANMLDKLRDVPFIGDQIGAAPGSLHNVASDLRAQSEKNFDAAGSSLNPLFQKATDQLSASFAAVADAFNEKLSNAGEAVDVSPFQENLDAAISAVGEKLTLNREKFEKKESERAKNLQLPELATKGGSASLQITPIAGFGVFLKDPLLAENRRHTALLEQIASNTANLKSNPPKSFVPQDPELRFSR